MLYIMTIRAGRLWSKSIARQFYRTLTTPEVLLTQEASLSIAKRTFSGRADKGRLPLNVLRTPFNKNTACYCGDKMRYWDWDLFYT